MTIKYANDLPLTDISRRLTNDMADLNVLLRDGRLESAGFIAKEMIDRLQRLAIRLDELCV